MDYHNMDFSSTIQYDSQKQCGTVSLYYPCLNLPSPFSGWSHPHEVSAILQWCLNLVELLRAKKTNKNNQLCQSWAEREASKSCIKNDWILFGKICLSPKMGWKTESISVAVCSGARAVCKSTLEMTSVMCYTHHCVLSLFEPQSRVL